MLVFLPATETLRFFNAMSVCDKSGFGLSRSPEWSLLASLARRALVEALPDARVEAPAEDD
jgi:hypothetical protein